MPVANPLGANRGPYAQPGLSSSQYAPGQAQVGGNANIVVAGLVATSLLVLLALHLAGFRFAFDASIGRH